MSILRQRDFDIALQARDRAIGMHLYDPNVTLVDIGWRIKEESGKEITKELTVRAHLRVKARGKDFEIFAQKYPDRIIEERNIGFPVDIIESRYPLQNYFYPFYDPPERARFYNPLQGGISISNEKFDGYGTLGGIVRDRETGALMVLSNWHVLAGFDYLNPGSRILQPGYGDGGRSRDTIAYFKRHAMEQGIDAAVAELIDARSISNDQYEIGQVGGVTEPKLDMDVMKSGRTSGITYGKITGIAGTTKINYGGFPRVINHVVHIAQSRREQVSSAGDSGSWWLDERTNKVVCLHFAGSNQPEYGIGIAMPDVLDALNVDII